MADPFGVAGGGHTGSNPFGVKSGQAVAGHHHSGVGGLVHKVGSDVKDAAIGVVPGIVTVGRAVGTDVVRAAEGPFAKGNKSAFVSDVAKPLAKSYKKTYGPLGKGDLGGFLHNLYEHPLGPVLDAAAVVTGGAGAVAKTGKALSEAGAISKTSRLARAGERGKMTYRSPGAQVGQDAKVHTRLTSTNPAIRVRQQAVHAALNKLPAHLPLLGETARFGKYVDRLPRQDALRYRAQLNNYNRAVRGLSNEEFAALHLIGRGVHPTDYVQFLAKQSGHVEPTMLKVLENPRVIDLFEHPTAKLEKAAVQAENLTKLDAALKKKHGAAFDEQANVERHARAVYGEPTGEGNFGKLTDAALRKRRDELATRYEKLLDTLAAAEGRPGDYKRVTAYQNAMNRKLGKRGLGFDPVSKQLRDYAESKLLHLLDNRPNEPVVKRVVAELDEAAAISKELSARADRSLFGHTENIARPALPYTPRFYVPDVPVGAARVANADFGRMGGGLGVPKVPSGMKQNKGVLFRTGQIALHPDLLGPEYLRTIKYGLHDDIHSELMSSAIRVSKDEVGRHGLPQGYQFLRKKIISRTGTPRPQQIHSLLTQKGAGLRQAEQLLPLEERLYEGFTVRDIADAETLHGDYLIVPERLAKRVSGEFTRSNSVVEQFFNKPTKVWRALVLGFRVGFLVNNVVGNHLLYAIHAAGIDGLRAYLNAVKREKGASTVKSLLSDREIPAPLRQQFMEEFFPEQTQTFTSTQHPTAEAGQLARTRTARRAKKLSQGLLPVTQKTSEEVLRRGLVETYIRRSPEFKQVYTAMPRETRDFEAAARRVMAGEGGPEYQQLISEQVDHALGNYTNLSPVERNVIRQVLPFYSWYRAIATITAHLALDNPIRASLLAKVGQLGVEDTQRRLGALPDYLRGVVPLGPVRNGHAPVLSTSGLNPFATIPQEIQGLGLLTGRPGETGKALAQLGPNPFLLALIQNLSGKELFSGKDLKGSPGGLIGGTVGEVGQQLPLAQLASAIEGHGRVSKLYGRQTALEALLQFLGAGAKSLDVAKANAYARPR